MGGPASHVLPQRVGAQAADVIQKPLQDTDPGRRRFAAPAADATAHRWHERSDDPARCELVRLITFVWVGRTGSQPVIYADRSWLQ